jgi:hypothetical protein
MLRYRNLGFLARDMFPDLMQGFVIDAEAEDMPIHAQPEVDVQDKDGNTVKIKKKPASNVAHDVSKDLSKKEPKVEDAEIIEGNEEKEAIQPNDGFDEEKKAVYSTGKEEEEDVPASFDPEIDDEGLIWNPEWKLYNEVELTSMGPVKALLPILEERGLMNLFTESPGKGSNKKARTIIMKHQEMTEDLRNSVEEMPEEHQTAEAPEQDGPEPAALEKDPEIDPRIVDAGDVPEGGRAFPQVKIIWDVLNNEGINEPKAKEIMATLGLDYSGKENMCAMASLFEITQILVSNGI